MVDTDDIWGDAQLGAQISAPGVRVSRIDVGRQTMLSGPGLAQGALGWPELAQGAHYRLCLRRDRVLEVGGKARETGWDRERGCAITDMSFALQVLEITGENAFDLLEDGTEISHAVASPSVARLFAGQPVLLYGWGGSNSFRLHVATPQAPALWHYLAAALGVQGASESPGQMPG